MTTSAEVRAYIIDFAREPLAALQLESHQVPSHFDLLREGAIDSFGIIELISLLEERFDIDIDLGDLNAADLTVIGPLSDFIAQQSQQRDQPEGG